jgi:hypothetical protein
MGLMDLLSHFAAQLTFTDFHAEATTSSKSWHGQSQQELARTERKCSAKNTYSGKTLCNTFIYYAAAYSHMLWRFQKLNQAFFSAIHSVTSGMCGLPPLTPPSA